MIFASDLTLLTLLGLIEMIQYRVLQVKLTIESFLFFLEIFFHRIEKKRNEEVVEEIPWDIVSASSILKTRSKFLKVRTKIKSDLNFTFQEQCQGIFLEPDRTQSRSCGCVLDASNVGMVKTLDGIYSLPELRR